jgi:two-component system chemotaxis sensor kinase CheA
MGKRPDISESHREAFLSEAEDHVRIWERTLLALEQDSANHELLQGLFRSIHTLKGCSGFVGCAELQGLCHALESALQDVREGRLVLASELVQLLFDGLDLSRRLIAAMAADSEFEGDIDGLVGQVESLRRSGQTATAGEQPPQPEQPAQGSAGDSTAVRTGAAQHGADATRRLVIDVQVAADRKEAYLRALLIRSKLEDCGTILEITPPLEELRLSDEEFRFRVYLKTAREIEDLRRDVDIDQVNILGIQAMGPGGTGFPEPGGADEQLPLPARGASDRPKRIEEVVRVPVDKLDVMMNLVGELVVQNSGFVSSLKYFKDTYDKTSMVSDLEQKTEALAQIARSLQDAVMKIRMLPLATIFSRFHRVVRDLAKHRNKEILLEIFGEETEIDKRVMDRIAEPLIHLLRNSVDHGIEPGPDRAACGKEREGLIRLGAYQEGDRICLQVSDDGRGLDRQAIAAKAIETGLTSREDLERMSDEQLVELIFLPGFSTATEVTDVSGRGVGLDIVKRTVDEMGGSVRVLSTLGQGMSTIITLPLTMAIINALLVESGGVTLAIPLSSVQEVIQPRLSELETAQDNRLFRLREEVIAVLPLERALGLRARANLEPPTGDPQLSIVVVDYSGRKLGLMVDALRGREEIVIKSLGKNFKEVEGLVGVSIMGTGQIALIIDTKAMLDSFYRDNQADLSFVQQLTAPPPKLEAPIAVFTSNPAVTAAQATVPADVRPERVRGDAANEKTEGPSPPWGPIEKSRLDKILVAGAVQASQSLTELLNRDVHVSFPEVKLLPLVDVAAVLGGPENQVGGIYVAIEGDIVGGALLVLPMEQVLQFSDLLFNRPLGTTEQIGVEEASGLKETGNMLTASFIGAIANATQFDVRPRIPEMSMDMCQAVIDGVLARFNHPGSRILLIEAELFYAEVHEVLCHLLILLERESMQRLLRAVALPAGWRAGK